MDDESIRSPIHQSALYKVWMIAAVHEAPLGVVPVKCVARNSAADPVQKLMVLNLLKTDSESYNSDSNRNKHSYYYCEELVMNPQIFAGASLFKHSSLYPSI